MDMDRHLGTFFRAYDAQTLLLFLPLGTRSIGLHGSCRTSTIRM